MHDSSIHTLPTRKSSFCESDTELTSGLITWAHEGLSAAIPSTVPPVLFLLRFSNVCCAIYIKDEKTPEVRLHQTNRHHVGHVTSNTGFALGKWLEHAVPSSGWCINTLRPWQNGRHFPDIIKRIFLNENVWILIIVSQKFVPKGSINNIPALVQMCQHSLGVVAYGRKRCKIQLVNHSLEC